MGARGSADMSGVVRPFDKLRAHQPCPPSAVGPMMSALFLRFLPIKEKERKRKKRYSPLQVKERVVFLHCRSGTFRTYCVTVRKDSRQHRKTKNNLTVHIPNVAQKAMLMRWKTNLTMDGPNESEVLWNLVRFYFVTSTLLTLYWMCFCDAVTPIVNLTMKFKYSICSFSNW